MSKQKHRGISSAGKRFLRGRRFDVSRRLSSRLSKEPDRITLPDGHTLTVPESIVYRALIDLGIEFEPMYAVRGGVIDFF